MKINTTAEIIKQEMVVEYNDIHMIFPGKFRKPVYALDSMGLKIPSGSIVGLLGPNGCGKTTAVSCLLGLLFPQKGEIKLWGYPIEKMVTKADAPRIGVVLEDTRLPPFMTVAKALTAVCELRNVPKFKISLEVERIVEATRIKSLLDHRINGLSKGQARRVGVAAALINDPPLLVMDEPASGLDISARIEFNDLVRNLDDGNRTILITSHLLSDVENTCTHIAIMQSGNVKVFGETQHLIANNSDDSIDIFIHNKYLSDLDHLKLLYDKCKYPQLIKIIRNNGIPAHEVLGLLANHKIVPARIEPCEDLISYYLSVTENEELQ